MRFRFRHHDEIKPQTYRFRTQDFTVNAVGLCPLEHDLRRYFGHVAAWILGLFRPDQSATVREYGVAVCGVHGGCNRDDAPISRLSVPSQSLGTLYRAPVNDSVGCRTCSHALLGRDNPTLLHIFCLGRGGDDGVHVWVCMAMASAS